MVQILKFVYLVFLFISLFLVVQGIISGNRYILSYHFEIFLFSSLLVMFVFFYISQTRRIKNARRIFIVHALSVPRIYMQNAFILDAIVGNKMFYLDANLDCNLICKRE